MIMDDSLDDFFAKKDKSKKKTKSSKSKFVAADLLPPSPAGTPPPPAEADVNVNDGTDTTGSTPADVVIVSEQKDKKKTKKRKDKDTTGESGTREDDEWNEIIDEIDYSGLRIQTKNIAKEAADEAAQSGKLDPVYDEDGKIIERPPETTVWSKQQTTLEEEKDKEEMSPPTKPDTPPPMEELAAKIPSRYVPPSMRSGAANLTPVSIKRMGRGKKQAPNITSTADFPTLGAAPPVQDVDTSSFEQVRGGGRNEQHVQGPGKQRLETSNIYSALQR